MYGNNDLKRTCEFIFKWLKITIYGGIAFQTTFHKYSILIKKKFDEQNI